MRTTSRRQGSGLLAAASLVGLLVALAAGPDLSGAGRRFFDDDPIAREPETQDAKGVEEWENELFWDLLLNLFAKPGDSTPNVRARNVNTVDEVPDSNWFTNRLLATPLSPDDVARGPQEGDPPAPGRWTIVRGKEIGAAPGFTARDEKGQVWFVSFDPKGYPEAATGAIMVANKIFWTLGYWQVENYLATIRPDDLEIADTATIRQMSGGRRRMKREDLEAVFRRAARNADGSFRVVAGRALPGKFLGGFRYHGTRPDDPNDIVPHEHRRELRALKVFGAWTNLVDMKAGNTVDTLITENGRSVVRHWLQDVGSTFGIGANGPRDWDEGWEYLYDGDKVLKRLASGGFYLRPWQTAKYEEFPAIGRFESEKFDPEAWRSRVPAGAVIRARDDDTFWAARRVMAFSDEMIRAAVRAGQYSDPAAAKHLGDTLIARRDKIGRAYLTKVNPLVQFALDPSGALTFRNAAVEAKVADPPKGGYRARWFAFDNTTGETSPIGGETQATSGRLEAPAGLLTGAGAYVKVEVSAVEPAHASWAVPVAVYFRQVADAWKLVGLERMP